MPGTRKSAWQQCCHAAVYSAPLAAAMLVPYGPTWPHLTHSCGTKNIPAALSLLPYQRGDRDFKPQSLVRISAKSLILKSKVLRNYESVGASVPYTKAHGSQKVCASKTTRPERFVPESRAPLWPAGRRASCRSGWGGAGTS